VGRGGHGSPALPERANGAAIGSRAGRRGGGRRRSGRQSRRRAAGSAHTPEKRCGNADPLTWCGLRVGEPRLVCPGHPRPTCPTPSGRCSRRSCRRRSRPAGRGSGPTASSPAPCSTCCGRAARGAGLRPPLPREFPAAAPPRWPTVFSRFRRWRLDGTPRRAHDVLRLLARRQAGRAPEPMAAVIDSQSAKTTGVGGARLQRRQADKGQKTPYPRQYRGVSAQSQGPLCQRLRPRRDKAASGGSQGVVAAHVPPVA